MQKFGDCLPDNKCLILLKIGDLATSSTDLPEVYVVRARNGTPFKQVLSFLNVATTRLCTS